MTRIATDGIARNHSYNLWHFAVLRDLILIAQKIYKIPYTSNTDGIIRDHPCNLWHPSFYANSSSLTFVSFASFICKSIGTTTNSTNFCVNVPRPCERERSVVE